MFIEEIEIGVQRKRIKRIHLHVRPDKSVYISAPYGVSNETIEDFARTNIQWIRDTIKKYESVELPEQRRYISGETIYIFGKKYDLVFIPGNGSSFYIKDKTAYLIMSPSSTANQRIEYMRKIYRGMLEEKMSELFPKWERVTGLKPKEIRTKYMKTRWGTCNYKESRVWLALQLVQKLIQCIEYVILHELTHLRIPNHSREFWDEVEKYMPDWRDIKQQLNVSYRCEI